MATRNIQMNILTDSGSYDTLYPQTTASQAGARPSTWMPTASDVGALPISGGTLTGDLKIKGGGNYGTMLSLGDGDYVHFYEKEDDVLEVKSKKVNFLLSDTSDSRFTINNVNPFGPNGDSTLEKVSMKGNNSNQMNITFSKETSIIFGICAVLTTLDVVGAYSFVAIRRENSILSLEDGSNSNSVLYVDTKDFKTFNFTVHKKDGITSSKNIVFFCLLLLISGD